MRDHPRNNLAMLWIGVLMTTMATSGLAAQSAVAPNLFSPAFQAALARSMQYDPAPAETLVARAAARMGYNRCGHLDTLSQGHVVACDLDLYTLDSRLRMRRWGRLRPDGTVEGVKGDLLTGPEGPEAPEVAVALRSLLRAQGHADLASELDGIIARPDGYRSLGVGLVDTGYLVNWPGSVPAFPSASTTRGRSLWAALYAYWPEVDNSRGRGLLIDCESRTASLEPPARARWTGQGLPAGRAIYAAGEPVDLDGFSYPARFTVSNVGGEFFALERIWAGNPCGAAPDDPEPPPTDDPGDPEDDDIEPDPESEACALIQDALRRLERANELLCQ